jgi:hypothetical protein
MLIPRENTGIEKDRTSRKICRLQGNKAEIPPRQKEHLDKKFL